MLGIFTHFNGRLSSNVKSVSSVILNKVIKSVRCIHFSYFYLLQRGVDKNPT